MSDAGGVHLLSLTTALGADILKAISFQAFEAISVPFVLEVDAVAEQSQIDPTSVLFKPACLQVVRPVGGTRLFNGMVRSITASGMPQRGYFSYRLSIVPKLWFMGQTLDCRIFQQQTVGQILTTLCGEAGQTISQKIFGSQTPQEYVTQYNETDLQFVSRLMEQAGYFYYFLHTTGDHTLVVTDQNQGFPAGAKPVLAVVHEGGNLDTLYEWHRRPATAWGSATLQDYDPANPDTPPAATTPTTLPYAGAAQRDVMQWPALTFLGQTVTDRTGFMIQAAEAAASLTDAAGSHHMMMPGARFTLYRDPFSGAEQVDYLVQAVRHQGTDETWIAGSDRVSYVNSLTVFPALTPWRQPLVTPRPAMAGIFAAIVLGDPGEEIHADNLGRIKVRLKWDHRQQTVADMGVWARVMQPWAGNTWGWQHLPRVGTEVAVAFMDGDADRPVVLGGLYNGDMQPVFAIPAEQTKSGWRTRSTLGGGTSNFSELSVDDKMGSELVYLHAEKDLTTEVENDQTLSVGNNRTVSIQQQESITVGAGRTATISKGGDALTVQAGDLTVQVSTGSVSVQALTKIELTVGGNSITIDQSGITLNGIMIKVQGQAMVQVSGAMTQLSADGMMTIQGGIVMVN
jgi:type VI secretion system secreted protein VgrG